MAFVTKKSDLPSAQQAGNLSRPWARFHPNTRELGTLLVALAFAEAFASLARGSDHLDSPVTVANPQADVSDVYAWISLEGQQLNLVMTLQGHTFSNKVDYVLHVDSGRVFGKTTASTSIACRFDATNAIRCDVGKVDSASGDATNPAGLEGRNHHFRVYAGLRDDPFYNNVKGLLGAYQTAYQAIGKGAAADAAGCAHFDEATTQEIRNQMEHSDGAPAQNLLDNWTVSAIVISVNLSAVSQGGKLLAVWGSTSSNGKSLDRMARPFVANTLLGIAPFSTDDLSGRRRQEYNEAPPGTSTRFIADLQKSLAFEDSLDGLCGNQLLAETKESPSRYRTLAKVFADSQSSVELGHCGRGSGAHPSAVTRNARLPAGSPGVTELNPRRATLRLVFLMCFSESLALAHDFWLQPKQYWIDPDALTSLTLQVGHGPFRQRSPIPARRITRFQVLTPEAALVDLRGRLRLGEAAEDGDFRLTKPGPTCSSSKRTTERRRTSPPYASTTISESKGSLPRWSNELACA